MISKSSLASIHSGGTYVRSTPATSHSTKGGGVMQHPTMASGLSLLGFLKAITLQLYTYTFCNLLLLPPSLLDQLVFVLQRVGGKHLVNENMF